MAFVDPNPWDILTPYIEAMSPAALERLGQLMSRPIVDPPFHGEIAHCWDVKLEDLRWCLVARH